MRRPTNDCPSVAIGEGGRQELAGCDWLRHQRLKALTTSHPRVAIHTRVASKARTSMVMHSHPDRCSVAGVSVELAGSETSGRSTWKGAFMMRLAPEDPLWSPALVGPLGLAVHRR